METSPLITPIEMTPKDIETAQEMAKRMGYGEDTAYTSSSALWGLFCMAQNPEHSTGPECPGCIIKTLEFGLMFVQDLEDLHMEDLGE